MQVRLLYHIFSKIAIAFLKLCSIFFSLLHSCPVRECGDRNESLPPLIYHRHVGIQDIQHPAAQDEIVMTAHDVEIVSLLPGGKVWPMSPQPAHGQNVRGDKDDRRV